MNPNTLEKIRSYKSRVDYISGLSQEEKELSIIFWIRSTMSPAMRKKEDVYHQKEEEKILKILKTLDKIEFFENIDKMSLLSMSCFSRCFKLYKYIKERIDFTSVVKDKFIEDVDMANSFIGSRSPIFKTSINEIIVDFFSDPNINETNKTKLYARCWLDFNLNSGLFTTLEEHSVLEKRKKELNLLIENISIDEDIFCSTIFDVSNLKHVYHFKSFYDSLDYASYTKNITKDLVVNKILENKDKLYESKELVRFLMNNNFDKNEIEKNPLVSRNKI